MLPQHNFDRTYAKQPYLVGANGRSPLQAVYNWVFCVSPVRFNLLNDLSFAS